MSQGDSWETRRQRNVEVYPGQKVSRMRKAGAQEAEEEEQRRGGMKKACDEMDHLKKGTQPSGIPVEITHNTE